MTKKESTRASGAFTIPQGRHVYRIANNEGAPFAWRVDIIRNGCRFQRRFHDELWGGEEGSLAAARRAHAAVWMAFDRYPGEAVVALFREALRSVASLDALEEAIAGALSRLEAEERAKKSLASGEAAGSYIRSLIEEMERSDAELARADREDELAWLAECRASRRNATTPQA